jgi:hypothetical protein
MSRPLWEYLTVGLYDDFESSFGEGKDKTTRYASVSRAYQPSQRIDLWVRIGSSGSYEWDVKKTIVSLFTDLGKECWELVSAQAATSGMHQSSTTESYIFKRLQTADASS